MTPLPFPPEPLLSSVLAHVRDTVVVSDPHGHVRWTNAASPSLAGARVTEWVHPDDRPVFMSSLRSLADTPGASRTITCRVADGTGGWRSAELTVANHLHDPVLTSWVTVVRPSSEPSHGRLPHRSSHDLLTELPNRATMLRRLEGPGTEKVAVLAVGLDGFRAINDRLGHAAGDTLLIAVAERLRRAVRPGDTVGRIGGDEFVILAAGIDRAEDALDIAQRARGAIAIPVVTAGQLVSVTASVGVAVGAERLATTLLRDADAAMYRAKQAGRDRCEVWVAPTGDDVARIPGAGVLEGLALQVVYDTVADLRTGAIAGAQALVATLRGPENPLMPVPFGVLASRGERPVTTTAGLLDRACCDAAAAGAGQVWVGLSGELLHDRQLTDLVASSLVSHALPPERLVVDVEERTLAAAGRQAWSNLGDLKTLGVGLCISGFGSGGAGLGYLRRAHIDVLALDPAFVAGLSAPRPSHGGDLEVVRAFLGMAHGLGVDPAVKGVASAEQLPVLARMGCRYALGPAVAPTIASPQFPAGERWGSPAG